MARTRKKFEVNKFKCCATGAAGGAFTANIVGIGTQRCGWNYQKVSLIKNNKRTVIFK